VGLFFFAAIAILAQPIAQSLDAPFNCSQFIGAGNFGLSARTISRQS
jgi:hypothetical protein